MLPSHDLKILLCAQVKKVREPHPDIGCWWTLYDYGLDAIKKWDKEYKHPYPGRSHPRDVHIRPCKLKTNMHWEKAHPSHKHT